jgi:hypothetical protein
VHGEFQNAEEISDSPRTGIRCVKLAMELVSFIFADHSDFALLAMNSCSNMNEETGGGQQPILA